MKRELFIFSMVFMAVLSLALHFCQPLDSAMRKAGNYFYDLVVGNDLSVTGDATVGGTLDVTGIATFSDELKIGTIGKIYETSDDIYIVNLTSDKDIVFQINDGGVMKTVATFDGSAAQLVFNNLDSIEFTAAESTISGAATRQIIQSAEIYLSDTTGPLSRLNRGTNDTDKTYWTMYNSAGTAYNIYVNDAGDGWTFTTLTP